MLNLTEDELLNFCRGDEVMEEFEKKIKKLMMKMNINSFYQTKEMQKCKEKQKKK